MDNTGEMDNKTNSTSGANKESKKRVKTRKYVSTNTAGYLISYNNSKGKPVIVSINPASDLLKPVGIPYPLAEVTSLLNQGAIEEVA